MTPATEIQIATQSTTGKASPRSLRKTLQLIGLASVWIGYFAPWVQHRAAALTLNAYDLAEWITFLPEVREGRLPLGRLYFLGLFALVLLLTVAWSGRNFRRRLLAVLLAAPGTLILLPGYPFILFWREDGEVQAQLVLFVATWLGLMSVVLLARSRRRELAFVALLLAAVGGALAVWNLLTLRPVVTALYGAQPPLGWGWLLALAGFLVVMITYVWTVIVDRKGNP